MLSTLRPCCHAHAPRFQPTRSPSVENCTPQREQSIDERANSFFLEEIQPAIKSLRCKAWSEAQLLELLLQVWNARITPEATPTVSGKSLDAVRLQLPRMMKQMPKSVIDFANDAMEDEQRILYESIKKCCSSKGREEILRAAGWQPGATTEDDSPNEARTSTPPLAAATARPQTQSVPSCPTRHAR